MCSLKKLEVGQKEGGQMLLLYPWKRCEMPRPHRKDLAAVYHHGSQVRSKLSNLPRESSPQVYLTTAKGSSAALGLAEAETLNCRSPYKKSRHSVLPLRQRGGTR